MADLKKTCSKPYKLAEFDVDDFIDDVDNYTHGRQSFIFPPQLTVVESATEAHQQDSADIADADADADSVRKNATFSLTTDTIATLSQLSQMQDMNKSKLIRMLIKHFAKLDASEQIKVLALER